MFPSNNTPLVLEQFNTSWACFKREVVNLVSKSGDILTVSRAYEESVQDDTASIKTITQNALSFNLDQGIVKISQYMTAKIFDELENEVVLVRTELWADILTAVQKQNVVYGASSTGNDSYAITLSPVPASLTAWMVIRFLSDVVNTGPATLNVNGLWAKTIKKLNDIDLATWDIEIAQIVEVVYNLTNDVWEMTSQIATLPTVDIDWLPWFTVPATWDKFIAFDVSAWANWAITYANLKTAILQDAERYNVDFVTISLTSPTATTTITYSHSLWKIPKRFECHSIWGTWQAWSHGFYEEAKYWSVSGYASSTNLFIEETSIWCIINASTVNYLRMTLSNITSTNFDVTYTEVWSATAWTFWLLFKLT